MLSAVIRGMKIIAMMIIINFTVTDTITDFKGLSHLVQSCLLYRSCMSKDSARSTDHVGHFFPKNIA